MDLFKLPFELRARIFDFVGADGLLQLSYCSHSVADMALQPNTVMHQISGHGSLLLTGQPSDTINVSSHSACRDLLRKQIDLENGEFETGPALEEAMRPKSVNRWFSGDRRFCAIVTPMTLEIWDHLTDRLLFTEALEHHIPQLEAERYSRAFIYFEDNFIVIFRTHNTMSEFDFPMLHIEFISFSVSAIEPQSPSPRPLLVLRHRCLEYGVDDSAGYFGWYHKENHQLRVLQKPGAFLGFASSQFHDSTYQDFEHGAIDHWNVSTFLDQSIGHQFRLDGFAAFCGEGSAVKGWYIFITDQEMCHGVAGAPLSIPQSHIDPDSQSPATLHGPPSPECALFFRDQARVRGDDPHRRTHQTNYQSIPLDRPWYLHVYDSVGNKAMEWPSGSEFHFSRPEDHIIEYKIEGGALQLTDGLHNCWQATRQSSVMSPLPRGFLQPIDRERQFRN